MEESVKFTEKDFMKVYLNMKSAFEENLRSNNPFIPMNYVLNPFDNETLAQIINYYEDWRCAIGEESIYDLENMRDFICIADQYGYQKAKDCRNLGRFWYGGNNFSSPLIAENLTESVNVLLDEDFFISIFDNGYEDELSCWFDINGLRKYIYGRQEEIDKLEFIREKLADLIGLIDKELSKR